MGIRLRCPISSIMYIVEVSIIVGSYPVSALLQLYMVWTSSTISKQVHVWGSTHHLKLGH